MLLWLVVCLQVSGLGDRHGSRESVVVNWYIMLTNFIKENENPAARVIFFSAMRNGGNKLLFFAL